MSGRGLPSRQRISDLTAHQYPGAARYQSGANEQQTKKDLPRTSPLVDKAKSCFYVFREAIHKHHFRCEPIACSVSAKDPEGLVYVPEMIGVAGNSYHESSLWVSLAERRKNVYSGSRGSYSSISSAQASMGRMTRCCDVMKNILHGKEGSQFAAYWTVVGKSADASLI